ncbi:hypothetical protein [Haliangium sp.]|uniref:hypothetical protein n=1 Tax=Haliangium sp. TaxID=2663208 RepID=UPI003D10B4FA
MHAPNAASSEQHQTHHTAEHRALKARLRELDSPAALSSAEQVERAQLEQRLRELQSH